MHFMRTTHAMEAMQAQQAAVATGSLAVVQKLVCSLYGDFVVPPGMWIRLARDAGMAGHGHIMQWAQSEAQRYGVCVMMCAGCDLAAGGHLDLLQLLEAGRLDVPDCVQCRSVRFAHEHQWLQAAVNHLQAPVGRWILERMAVKGLAVAFWEHVESMASFVPAHARRDPGRVKGIVSSTAPEHRAMMALWHLLKAHPAAYEFVDFKILSALTDACRWNNLPFAKFLYGVLAGHEAYVHGYLNDRTLGRIICKYAPHVACWLQTVLPAVDAWPASARARTEAQPLAVWAVAMGTSELRFTWIAAATRVSCA